MISGLEKGMEGQCAGEKIVMVVPPEYGYGDKSADKVNISKPLYSAYKKMKTYNTNGQ